MNNNTKKPQSFIQSLNSHSYLQHKYPRRTQQAPINPQDLNYQRRISQHYYKLKQFHYKKLSQCNLSDNLKKKLFGFSNGHYCSNQIDPYSMIIQNHPLKGRIIMRDIQYQNHIRQQNKERDVKSSWEGSSLSLVKNHDDNHENDNNEDKGSLDVSIDDDEMGVQIQSKIREVSNKDNNRSDSQKLIYYQKL